MNRYADYFTNSTRLLFGRERAAPLDPSFNPIDNTKMFTRTFVRASAVALAIFAGSMISAFAQDTANRAISGINSASDVVEAVLDEALLAQETFVETGMVPIMVELHDVSAVTVLEQVTAVEGRAVGLAKAKGHAKKLDRDQQAIVGKLKERSPNGSVTYRLQRAMNAVAMVVKPSDVMAISALPEVKAVYPIVQHYPSAASSNPLMKVEAFWNSLPSGLNLRGTGVKVGVIDTGTDYLHTAFGGPGLTSAAAGVTDTNANGYFPNAKFPGGWDFAGNAYTGSNTPQPDSNPMDTNGHGTAVASLIGGRGTNSNGTTYAGPYNSTTNYGPLRTSPGVAPDALIYPLRVFGTSGSTGLTHLAIEWAMDPNGDGDMSDRLDVINLSLGATNGHHDDTSAITANAASKAGIVVVISAGNAYNIYYITGSPSVADGAISVAASLNDNFYQTLTVNSPAGVAKNYPMVPAAFGPAFPAAGITSDLVIANPILGNGDPLVGLTNAAAVSGKIVVMDRGTFGFTTKVRNAQNSGAIGVIMVNSVAGAPTTMGGTDPLVTIPSAMISQADGATLKAAIALGTVNATPKSVTGAGADSLAVYSSRGPRRGDSMLKPDISAPAELVSAAAVNTGNGNTTFNGTSSAAPHMAGGMALMRQANPGWTPEELKALAMNTAGVDQFEFFAGPTPLKWSLARAGAGRTDLQGAARSKVIAFNKDRPDLVSVSYGQVEAAQKLNLVKHISVRNKGRSRATYNISWQPNLNLPGVSLDLDNRKDISVPAGVTNHFPIKLRIDPAQLKNVRDPLVPATERVSTTVGIANQPRHFLNEFAGHVVLTPASGGAPALRVPVWASVRPAGRMSATGASITMDVDNGAISVPVAGTEVNTGASYPNDITGLVKGFELQYEGTANPAATGYLAGADIQYVGVASDWRTRGNTFTNSVLNFGISTFGNWDTPSNPGVELQVQIDHDKDGVIDYTVFTRGPGDLDTSPTSPSTSNVYVVYFTRHTAPGTTGTFLFPARPVNGLTPALINTYAMNNSVVSIDIPASTVLATSANGFRYKVRGIWRGVLVSETPWMDYNPTKQGLDSAGAFLEPFWHFDTNGNSVPVQWNKANYLANNSLGLLLIHLHNVAGMRAEKVPVVVVP